MRPTGKLHLGHLVGALQNWVTLQDKYDSFHCVVDWHALTTHYADTSEIVANTFDNVADWIGAGLDPEKSTFFIQSLVPEHAELYLLFQMVTPIPWLERVPTYKEQVEQLSDRDLSSIGFLGYPLLQAADIAVYDAHWVPVGEDQVPHLELTREVVRRFNNYYPANLVEPQALLTPTPRLPGLDNRKMSKSYNNTIALSDTPEKVKQTIRTMVTDPARVRRHDKGNPDVCPVGDYHKVFSDTETLAWVDQGCRTAGIGCIECKMKLFDNLQQRLGPISARRQELESHPDDVLDILNDGAKRAKVVAEATMADVRKAMKI